MRIACIFDSVPGLGGLGVQADNVLTSLAAVEGGEVWALGLAPAPSARCASAQNIRWITPPSPWFRRAHFVPWLRQSTGALVYRTDVFLGRWAARELPAVRPDLCYAFTQVALESFEWCASSGVPTILESPNGHLSNFRRVYVQEHAAWCRGRYVGHPTEAMVARVVREYALATRIRASSKWTVESLVSGGVPRQSITPLEQPVDLARYQPVDHRADDSSGPLRVCFVGSLDLRKGFVYLLDAFADLEPGRFSLEIVGATGDRCCRRLLDEKLPPGAACAPGDPRPAFARASIFALPTLEDGLPFAVAEAMASGLPVIVTNSCGAAEWVNPQNGWVVAPQDAGAIRRALHEADNRRATLTQMGRHARLEIERHAGEHCYRALADWVTAAV